MHRPRGMTTIPNIDEYRNLEDQELVTLLKTGDKIAFTVIYERYVRVLYTLVVRYVKNREDTLDILQVTFEKLWMLKEELIPSMSIKSYLYTMTKNAVLNYVRNQNNALIHNYKIVQQRGEIEDDIYLQAEQRGEIQELFAAINQLPEQQKKVAQYRCEGFSNKEIAQMMGLSLNTVNSHYSQCLKNLKKKLSYIVELILVFVLNIWGI